MSWNVSLYSSNQTLDNLPKRSTTRIENTIDTGILYYLGNLTVDTYKLVQWLDVLTVEKFFELSFNSDDEELEYLDTLIKELQLMYLGKSTSSYIIPYAISINDINFLRQLRELLSYNTDIYIYGIIL